MPSRKRNCNCRNSRCLKLYCECFASGLYCERCNCTNCCNNLENAAVRQEAIEATLERNPNAFRPKIAPSPGAEEEADGLGRHNKGCHCKKSSCLKKYCECFQANIFCSDICRCVDCKNFEGSTQRALTAAKMARQSVSSPSPRKGLASVWDAAAKPSKDKASSEDEARRQVTDASSMLPTNERSRCVSHTKMEFAVASTSQPSTDLEMLPINVEDLSHSLLMASKNIKHNELKRLSTARVSGAVATSADSPHRKILVLSQRRHETLGREAKSSKTEEEMSPLTKALLCDEADNMFEHATFIPSGHQEFARSQDNAVNLSQMDSRSSVSSAFMDRESSVISELTKTVRNLVETNKARLEEKTLKTSAGK